METGSSSGQPAAVVAIHATAESLQAIALNVRAMNEQLEETLKLATAETKQLADNLERVQGARVRVVAAAAAADSDAAQR